MTAIDLKSVTSPRYYNCMEHPVIPFLIALGGVLSDYLTTNIGLSMGFYEAHPYYHPLWGIFVFFSIITALTVLLPRQRLCKLSIIGIALASYLGTFNNTLVILGLFPGIPSVF